VRIIKTAELQPGDLNRNDSLWIYNGLDCAVTYEILDALLPQLSPVTAKTYALSKALQGPVLDMNSRGLLVDEECRQQVIAEYKEEIYTLTLQVNRLIREGIGWQFTPSPGRKYQWPSDEQLKILFYDHMKIPEIKKRDKNGSHVTVDRGALEQLEHYFYAEPIIGHILLLRDLAKKVSFLSTAIDSDGRLRTSFNIAGTRTGRFAASLSDFGTGTNLQNVENKLRAVFVPDPGYKFCNIDLEQSDSRAVGAIHWNLFRDGRYLDACESGDLHTTVARDGFPALSWTGDLYNDRYIADGKFYREFSYRDASKKLGHGTNYQGKPDEMHRQTKIQLNNIITFQQGYLRRFPAFPLWWQWVERQIRDVRRITTLLGRQRYFLGDWKDPETIRQGVAYEPQSVTADTINRGILRLWRANICQLLVQVHDSILFQFPEDREAEVVPAAIALIEETHRLKDGRDFKIPAEAKVGWNWADDRPTDPKRDPDSLRKFTDASRPQTRSRQPKV
jgi:DNA polymerase I-like protein with 3'-5' exonuclease and polymerase domains